MRWVLCLFLLLPPGLTAQSLQPDAERLSPELIGTAIISIRDMDKGFGFSSIAKTPGE